VAADYERMAEKAERREQARGVVVRKAAAARSR
jgi:hypothetical protein